MTEGPSAVPGGGVGGLGGHGGEMARAVAGMLAEGETEIEEAECVEISYLWFCEQLEDLC